MGTMLRPESTRWAAFDTPAIRRVLTLAAVLGFVLGIQTLVLHLKIDPLADVRAYYDAGARLNAGAPLYVQPAGPNDASFYRYPPLLAIVFRPLALLSYDAAAAIWEAFVVGTFVLTIFRLGQNRRTWLALGMLALPIGWSLAVGQAQVPMTFLMALGTPWAIALAANIKLFPAVLALYWLGRRDVRSLVAFAMWLAVFGLIQLLLEPAATLAFPRFVGLEQVGAVNNRSLYALSPQLWAVAIAIGTGVTILLARSRYGWAAAVALSVFATPRLLVYQLSSLAAALRTPDERPAAPGNQ
jgi:hypothetical protein